MPTTDCQLCTLACPRHCLSTVCLVRCTRHTPHQQINQARRAHLQRGIADLRDDLLPHLPVGAPADHAQIARLHGRHDQAALGAQQLQQRRQARRRARRAAVHAVVLALHRCNAHHPSPDIARTSAKPSRVQIAAPFHVSFMSRACMQHLQPRHHDVVIMYCRM